MERRTLQKKSLEEKVQKAFIQLFPIDKNNADHWFRVCTKNWKVKKTKIELVLIKIVDCFLDGHGNYDSILVSFNLKSL